MAGPYSGAGRDLCAVTSNITIRMLQPVVLLCMFLMSAQIQAQVCRVTTDGTDTGDGSNWVGEAMDLHSALGNTGCEQIWVAGGVYKPHTSDRGVSFTIARELELYGGFEGNETELAERDPAANPTILSGDIDDNDTLNPDGATETADDIVGENSYHVVYVIGATASGPITDAAVLDGLVITAGRADGSFPDFAGGGLLCAGEVGGNECSPTLRNMVFMGNHGDLGGAMYNAGGSNGISNPVLESSTFSGNSASQGGAMYNDGSLGGSGSPSLNNVTFSGNSADLNGGAIYNRGVDGNSNPTLNNVTFSANVAADNGGAMYNNGEDGQSNPVLNNVILWTNSATDGSEIFNQDAEPQVNDSVVQGGCPDSSICSNIIIQDPLLEPLVDNGGSTKTMRPNVSSSAVDAGNSATCLDQDQRGLSRPQLDACDIGAVELAFPVIEIEVVGAGVVDAGTNPVPIRDGIAACDQAGQGQPHCRATYTEDDMPALTVTRSIGWYIESVDGCGGELSANAYTTAPLVTACTVDVVFSEYRICRVTTTGTDTGDGSDWTTEAMDLHAALADVGCLEIWVAGGRYTPHASDRSVSFVIDRELDIYGGFEGNETSRQERDPAVNPTVLSGDIDNNDVVGKDGVTQNADDIVGANSYHVVHVDGTSPSGPIVGITVVDGFIITAGHADGGAQDASGGGLICTGNGSGNECSPMLRNIVFAGNRAVTGGAVYNLGADGTSSPLLHKVTFTGNSAEDGGAMFSYASSGVSSPDLFNVTFSGNSANSEGGAIYHLAGSGPSSPLIRHSTFSANSAGTSGGAIYSNGGEPVVLNSIFWADSAADGSEIYNVLSATTPDIRYSIVQGGCPAGSDCTGVIDEDPQLAPLADNGGATPTMLPDAVGAAVDGGNDTHCLIDDQRGISRPQGSACDIGSVELIPLPPDDVFHDRFESSGFFRQ